MLFSPVRIGVPRHATFGGWTLQGVGDLRVYTYRRCKRPRAFHRYLISCSIMLLNHTAFR